jgi:hypothetical protein
LGGAAASTVDNQLISACHATEGEIHAAINELSAVDDAALTRIVAVPPDEWGLTMEDRVAVLQFLIRRRGELVAILPGI